MSKTVACIIARTVSQRLPLKVLRTVVDEFSLLEYLLLRVKNIKEVDEVYLCTSTAKEDDIMEDVASKTNVKLYRGSADAVIERMLDVGELTKADNLIRITGDNVFTSIEYIGEQIKFLEENKLDYVRLIDVPIGATAEVMTYKSLKQCYKSMDPSVSEYLMLYMFEPNTFKCGVIKAFDESFSNYSLTVDTANDLKRTKELFSSLNKDNPLNIKLKELIGAFSSVSYVEIKPSGQVKLPYGKVVTYQEFSEDMKRRIDGSLRLNLY